MQNSISQKFSTAKLLKFVLPSVVMMTVLSIFSMLGSIFAGKFINEYALSAINIVFPFISISLAVAIMFATGANAIISKNLGQGENERAKQNFTVVTIVSFLVGVAFTAIGLIFTEQIVDLLGGTGEIIPYAIDYLQAYSFIFPFLFIQVLSQFFFVTNGKPLLGMFSTLGCGALNILFSYLMIAVWNVGIISIAIGVAIAYVLQALIFVFYFTFKRNGYLCFVKPKWHKRFILNTCTNGSSEMVTNLAIAIVAAIMNVIMGNIAGEIGIAAVSVIVQVQFLLNSMFIGFGAGVAPIFAFAQGEDNREQTKNVFKISTILVAITSVILVSICLLFSNQITGLFIDSASESFALAETGFIIFSIGYLFAGINIFASVFFTAVGNGKVSAFISFLRTFAFIIGMLMFLPAILGTTGVWLSIPIAEFLGIIVSILILRKFRKKYHY